VRPGQGDLPAVLDVEARDRVNAAAFVTRMKQWLDIVEKATDRKPITYVSPSFWDELGGPRGFSGYPLWVANYGRSSPMIPRGWSTYTFWQYSSDGRVARIAGQTDLDFFNGTPENLAGFVATGQTPSGGRVSDEYVYEGDTGPDVTEIQNGLRAKGFNPGPVDGVFGPGTKAAVMAFQEARGLVVDGIVGLLTLNKLRS
jgi:lysozyme